MRRRQARPIVRKSWFDEQLKLNNMSQRDMAQRLGVHQSFISHMYTGTRRMSLDEADRWAAILDISIHDVMKNAGISVPASLLRPCNCAKRETTKAERLLAKIKNLLNEDEVK